MSDRKGVPPLVAGLLIVPIMFLVKALDFDSSSRYVPSIETHQPAEAYEALSYTEPKAPLTDANLKAAFPPFSNTRDDPRSADKTYSGQTLSIPKRPTEQDYVGRLGCGENGSCYGDLTAYGVPKEVYVQGSYRADGTYVRSHYRSRPKRS